MLTIWNVKWSTREDILKIVSASASVDTFHFFITILEKSYPNHATTFIIK